MRMNADSNQPDQIKGVILFPCCPKEKIIVYAGSSGRTSNKCPQCKKMAEFDLDQMKADAASPMRGVVHKFKTA